MTIKFHQKLTAITFAVTAVSIVYPSTVPLKAQENTVPLHRLYFGNRNRNADHLYTTKEEEVNNVRNRSNWSYEGIAARCFSTQVKNTIPLYRLYHVGNADHFYTTNNIERQRAMELGFIDEGTTCYVYPIRVKGSCPLYRLYYPAPRTEHLYTLSKNERDATLRGETATTIGGLPAKYNDEGIAGFLLPGDTQRDEDKDGCPD